MGSDTVAAAFRAAAEADRVRAILFRIDSPGGSYVASDTIWREVSRARDGGQAGDRLDGQRRRVGGLLRRHAGGPHRGAARHHHRLDRRVRRQDADERAAGRSSASPSTPCRWATNATMWSGLHDYTPAERARFEGALDRIYEDFTSKVAAGRKLPKEQGARGRQGPRLDRRGRARPRAGGRARRVPGGAPAGAPDPRARGRRPAPARVVPAATRAAERPRRAPRRSRRRCRRTTSRRCRRWRASLEAVQAITRTLRTAGLLGEPGELEVVLAPGIR